MVTLRNDTRWLRRLNEWKWRSKGGREGEREGGREAREEGREGGKYLLGISIAFL